MTDRSILKTNLIYILLVSLLINSCDVSVEDKTEAKKSDFNLASDFSELTIKMTELDTIKVWADLSSCMWMCTEQITITKSKDSLSIALKVFQMMDPEVSETIKIHKNDTTWDFNRFLANNKDRFIKKDERDNVHLRVSHLSDSIEFYTSGLADLNRFIGSYYETMFKLKPTNKAYEFISGNTNPQSRPKLEGVPESAFWSGINEQGHWFNVDKIHNHKNNAIISIYDGETGALITKNRFFMICPIDNLELIEDLEFDIDYFDGENIQLIGDCYLDARS